MTSPTETTETAQDRRELARDAGFGSFSALSVIGGATTAFGVYALLSGLVAAVADWAGSDTDYLVRSWKDVPTGAAVATIVMSLVAFVFGGYVAGRMARRLGTVHGLAVFVVGVVVAGLAVWFAQRVADSDQVVSSLRDLGVPGTGEEWKQVGTFAGIGSLVAALVGAVLGGALGEGWHGRLVSRAVDPGYGPEAGARQRAREQLALARDRHDEAVGRVARASGAVPVAADEVVAGEPPVATGDAAGPDLAEPPSPEATTAGERAVEEDRAREIQAHGPAAGPPS
jgi:hypothetical protein